MQGGNRRAFPSILFMHTADCIKAEASSEPDFFADINLSQVINAITATRQDYDLKPFFYTPLHDIGAIKYRYAVVRDLENNPLLNVIREFIQKLRVVREQLANGEKAHYQLQKQRWFLDATVTYCGAVDAFAYELTLANIQWLFSPS